MKEAGTSFLYIIFEGLSRGGNTLIFLVAASVLSKTDYVNLLALFSLEGLFINFSPLYYSDVLYKIRDKYKSWEVNNTVLFITIVYLFLLLFFLTFFTSILSNFYKTIPLVLYLIAFNSAVRIVYQNKSVNNQVDENHKSAIQDKAIPFFVSFLFGLICFLFFENKIIGFFVGRSFGYILVLLYTFSSMNIVIKPNIDKDIFKDYLSRSSFLIIKGVFGWILGYGILNFMKGWYSVEVNYQIGLILTLWSAFLLISNGINAVYVPSFRKAFLRGKYEEKKIYRRTLFNFFAVLIFALIIYLIFTATYFQEILKNFGWQLYFDNISYVLLIFTAQIFQYLSTPYFLVYDKFKLLSIIGVLTSILSMLCIIIHYFFKLENIVSVVLIFVFTYYLRSLPLFIYQKFYLNNK